MMFLSLDLRLVYWIEHGTIGAKPLSDPMLTYSQLDPKEQNSVKY